MHPDLHLAHLSSSTDLNEGLARRRAWQQTLNCKIQHISLQLLVGIFRYLRPSQHLGLATRLIPQPFLMPMPATFTLPGLDHLSLSSFATRMAVSWKMVPGDPVGVCVFWLRAQGQLREGPFQKLRSDSWSFPQDSETSAAEFKVLRTMSVWAL